LCLHPVPLARHFLYSPSFPGTVPQRSPAHVRLLWLNRQCRTHPIIDHTIGQKAKALSMDGKGF